MLIDTLKEFDLTFCFPKRFKSVCIPCQVPGWVFACGLVGWLVVLNLQTLLSSRESLIEMWFQCVEACYGSVAQNSMSNKIGRK